MKMKKKATRGVVAVVNDEQLSSHGYSFPPAVSSHEK
jgi:hypothetical protein